MSCQLDFAAAVSQVPQQAYTHSVTPCVSLFLCDARVNHVKSLCKLPFAQHLVSLVDKSITPLFIFL